MKTLFFYQQKALSLLLVLLMLLCNRTTAQQQYNLVNNYSFENYPVCPSLTKPQFPYFWNHASNYKDLYFNTCATRNSFHNVPYNTLGTTASYQWTRTGNAYGGIGIMHNTIQNGRDYMQNQLKSPLISNKKYYVEFYVTLANGCSKAANNIAAWINVDAKYRDTSSSSTQRLFISGNPQVYNYGKPFLTDTLNWMRVSSIFNAQGGEQNIIIGNFYDDINTDTLLVNPTTNNGVIAYYLDDVSVIPLDSFCLQADAGRDTTIKPNDSVFIGSYTNGIDTIKWYNAAGQVIDSVQPGFWVKPNAVGNYMYVVEQTVNGCYSRDTVKVNVSLPLTMINYKLLMINERQIENVWETSNEVNVSHYNIQCSTNGRDFITIGTVQANNKSSNEYSFNDPLTNNEKQETLYYRIVGVDKDGSKTYSEIKTLNFKPKTSNVQVYPNPTKDVVNITSKENIREVKVFDMFGRMIQSVSYKNTNHLSLNINHYQRGIYVISIFTSNNNVVNEKLIIQ